MFEGSQTFFNKKHFFSPLSLFIFPFIFSLLFHLVSSLVLSRLSSFIFSCLLVLSRLLLSSFLSFSVFFLCLSLSLSPCDVVCCVVWCVSLWSWCVFGVCVCVWCVRACVCVFVCCGTLKERGKTRVCGFKYASVCTFKTSPCMPAPSAHVFQHVRVMPIHTETF